MTHPIRQFLALAAALLLAVTAPAQAVDDVEVEHLKTKTSEHDLEIQDSRSKLSHHQADIDELRHGNNDRASRIAAIEAAIAALRQDLADLEQTPGPEGPQGLQGEPGPTGPQGPQGEPGMDGAPGPQGPEGPQGVAGVAGADGAQGPQGPEGPVGADGTPGAPGLAGADGLNCWDLNGDGVNDPVEDFNADGFFDAYDCQGPEGSMGPAGPQGPEGPAGVDASTIAGIQNAINLLQSEVLTLSGTPLVVTAPADAVVDATSIDGIPSSDPSVQAFLAGVSASGHVGSISSDAPAQLGIGFHIITFTATNNVGAQSAATALLEVVGTPAGCGLLAGQEMSEPLVGGGSGPVMVGIPGGTFTMGSPNTEPGRQANEGPQHDVTVPAFCMGKYEVRFDEYDAFANATGRALPNDSGFGRGTLPVIGISWDDAVAYTQWLSAQTGADYRLPSEAEWEYADRAGTTTARWWGDAIGTGNANCAQRPEGCGDSFPNTSPVGFFPPNGFGLHDTLGNVYEFTLDNYHNSYATAPTDGSAWLTTAGDPFHIYRGGSWPENAAVTVRSAVRVWGLLANETSGYAGFRVVRDN